MPVPEALLTVFRRQKYQISGNHSAVKICHWTKQSLRTNEKRFCYKQKFYGIRTLRCLQMTPSLGRCVQNCLYCWRTSSNDLNINWNPTIFPEEEADDPAFIVDETLKAHRRSLIGFKGNPKIDETEIELALKPNHVAISLEGEVTLYPYLGDLIEEFFKGGFKSVFLVTNGLLPSALSKLTKEPSQLYVSLSAPNERIYKRICRPLISNGWKRLGETLSTLQSFNASTVIRITLVRNLNVKNPKEYAKIISKANPTYLELKGAMALGFFRQRLKYNNMPNHSEVKIFSEDLANETGYRIIDESPESNVVLLSRIKKPQNSS